MLHGPMTRHGVRKVMARFEATGLLSIAPEKARKPASVKTEKAVELAVEDSTMKSTHDMCCHKRNGYTIRYGVQNCP